MSVSLFTTQTISRSFLSVLTKASSALFNWVMKLVDVGVACKNSGSFMKLNGFSSGSDASENNYFVLRLSFCLPES